MVINGYDPFDNKSPFSFLKRKFQKPTILLIGQTQVGKTTLLKNVLQFDENKDPLKDSTATVGFNRENTEIVDKSVNIYDMGGHESFKHLWFEKVDKSDFIIYVIDGEKILNNDQEYLKTDLETFENVLLNINKKKISLSKIPFLLLINKIDLYKGEKEDTFNKKVKEVELKVWNLYKFERLAKLENSSSIISASALLRYNVDYIAKYIYFVLTHKNLEIKTFIEQVRIYTKGGLPLITVGNVGFIPMLDATPFSVFSMALDLISDRTNQNQEKGKDPWTRINKHERTILIAEKGEVNGWMIMNKLTNDFKDAPKRLMEILDLISIYKIDDPLICEKIQNDENLNKKISQLISYVEF